MEKLIFEKSVAGRKGYTLPKLDVEKTDISIHSSTKNMYLKIKV